MTTNDFSFNEDEQDVLQELFNIAIGSASAVIAEMMEVFVNMHVPSTEITNMAGLKSHVEERTSPNENYFIANQIYSGEISGETVFFVNGSDTKNLVVHLEDSYDEGLANDVFLELSNIITAGFIGKLGELLETDFSLAQPTIERRMGKNLISFSPNELETKVIIANMEVDLEGVNVRGMFFLLSKTAAFVKLKKAVERYIQILQEE